MNLEDILCFSLCRTGDFHWIAAAFGPRPEDRLTMPPTDNPIQALLDIIKNLQDLPTTAQSPPSAPHPEHQQHTTKPRANRKRR